MTDILATGTSALLAFQRALSTVGNNVANVATPGYSRQRVDLSTRGGDYYGFGFIGAGVQVGNVQRIVDSILAGRTLRSAGELGRMTQFATLSGRVDTLFSDNATGLPQPFSNFFDAAQAVAGDPTSAAARQSLLGDAQNLVGRFRSLQGQLASMDRESDQRLVDGVADVNGLTSQIAALNREIVRRTGMAGGAQPNDLLDQRDELVRQLSTKIGVTTVVQDDGALNVFTGGGQTLVLGDQAQTLATVADPYQPTRHSLALSSASGPIAIADAAVGGELGGVLQFRHEVVDAAAARLGRIAAGLASAVNAQHREGMDFYGQMGGDFFRMPEPATYARSSNGGSATLTAGIVDASALTTGDIVLRYDGTNWTASDAATGAARPMSGAGTAASPFLVDGVSLVVGGGAAAGDSFLVRPTAEAAGRIAVAITDPNRIAAAGPLRGSAALGNAGNGTLGAIEVLDAGDANLLAPVTIQFTGPNTYSINGAGSYAYTEGAPIAINGWRTTLSGAPAAGDTFTIGPNGPRSNDNGNMRVLAGLDSGGVLDGGATSLTQGVAQLTSAIGSTARQAEYARSAQQAIDAQLGEQRNSVSGVNLDEEAADMMRFQQAYQAAAQIITVANETFQSILAAVRG